jgi:hypothetical protein
MKPRIRLAAKEEGLDYADESGLYRLNVYLAKKCWTVDIPGVRVADSGPWYPTAVQREAIRSYFFNMRLFGLISVGYTVAFQDADGSESV